MQVLCLLTPSRTDSTTLKTIMPEVDISPNGLLKLLHNLKPGKAAGPDMLKPLLLRELRDEIASVIKVILDRSLKTGKLPAAGQRLMQCPFSKKATNLWQPITDPFPSPASFARCSDIYLHQA